MKILEVFLGKTTASGPTTVLKPIIKRLNRKKHQVDVFSTLPYDSAREELANSLESTYYYMDGKYIKNKKHLLQMVPSLKEYELIHIHGMFNLNNILLARILKKLDIPYILSTHGNLMEESLKKSKYKKKLAIHLLIKNMLKNAKAIHALNNREAEDILKVYNHERIEVIPNGVGSTLFNKKESDFSAEQLNLLYIGRLDVKTKGLDILLNALDVPWFKEKVQLFLVGPYVSNKDREYIENRIQESTILQQLVKIEGPKYDAEKKCYYKKADVFIHTSRHEGMPMAVLESMVEGVPVIVTPGTNMVSLVQQSSGGFVTELEDKSIRETVKYIHSLSPGVLYKMGLQAKTWTQKELSWNQIAESYESLYQKISKN